MMAKIAATILSLLFTAAMAAVLVWSLSPSRKSPHSHLPNPFGRNPVAREDCRNAAITAGKTYEQAWEICSTVKFPKGTP